MNLAGFWIGLEAAFAAFGEYGGPWAILFSGSVAIWGIRLNRVIAGKRATLDLIQNKENSDGFRGDAAIFRAYVREGELSNLHEPLSPDGIIDRGKVLSFLNHYEIVSIAIFQNYLNEEIYRQFMLSNVLIDWNEAADFIQRERWYFNHLENSWEYQFSLYKNYETLVTRWAKQERKIIKLISKKNPGPPMIEA